MWDFLEKTLMILGFIICIILIIKLFIPDMDKLKCRPKKIGTQLIGIQIYPKYIWECEVIGDENDL